MKKHRIDPIFPLAGDIDQQRRGIARIKSMTPERRKEFIRQVVALLKVSTPDEQQRILAVIQDKTLRQEVKEGAGL